METSESLPLVVEDLTFRYWRRDEPAIQNVSFALHPGQIMLIAGASGCGKTTLMRCINGLIPHTYKGEIEGSIRLFGKSVADMEMAEISQTVGTVLQDPERQIVGSYVVNEVAFGLESLGFERSEIIRRVDESLERLNISYLRERETFGTSGGEKQKIALAGVLAMHPRILLLDEPLASLDPASAHEALQAFRKLADEGISVMIVEHRVEDVLEIKPDVMLYMDCGRISYHGDTAGLMQAVDYHAIKLPAPVILERAKMDPQPVFVPAIQKEENAQTLIEFKDVHFRYNEDSPEVLKGLNFKICRGDVIAVLGHNGSGKTTMVKHALGLLKPTSGEVVIGGKTSRQMSVAQAANTIGFVFQSPTQMLFAPTVREELAFGPKNLKMVQPEIERNVEWAIRTVHLEEEMEMPPLALSFGQQKRVSIAAILAMRSKILMMDEPTAGQDYWNYTAFMDSILQMPGFESVVFITHDVDLAVIYANRILLLFDGQIAADGSPHDVLKDDVLLKKCRIRSTSLLKLNLSLFDQTKKFYRGETLAHVAG